MWWIHKINYIIAKCLEYYDIIDIKARSAFKKGLSSSALKYFYSFSMHRTRDNIINTEKTNALCLKFS